MVWAGQCCEHYESASALTGSARKWGKGGRAGEPLSSQYGYARRCCMGRAVLRSLKMKMNNVPNRNAGASTSKKIGM